MPRHRRSPLPSCIYCSRAGLGDPPLCRRHHEEELGQHGADEPPIFEVIDRLIDHPRVQDWLGRFGDALGDRLDAYAASLLDREPRGPRTAAGYQAEWPPRVEPPPPPPPGRGNGRRAAASSPPPPPPPDDPWLVLGFRRDATLTVADIKERQRALALLMHPDRNGSDEAMRRVNAAAAALISHLSR